MGRLSFIATAWLSLATIASASALLSPSIHQRAASTSSPRLVFAHFMVGIVSDRTGPSDYDNDMIRAKEYGIDAFALNIGTDTFTDQQLGYAYQSAANNGMKVFISFDFNWYQPSTAAPLVGAKIKQFANEPGQLIVDGKVFASSFSGDGLNVTGLREAAAPYEVFWAPNIHPGVGNFSEVDGALNWMGWDSNGNNKAPTPGALVTVADGDEAYIAALNGKAYIAPASAWFSTHYGSEVSYSKNWVFPSDLLWFQRWSEILTLGPPFVEMITWNDYGESHYVGPLSSKHYDDGASKWANDMPHDGWLDMAQPFIAAYHAGKTNVEEYIKEDELIYWYRPTLGSINCDATDTCMGPAPNASGNYFIGKPNGAQDMADSVFVVSLLKSAGTVTVTSGSNAPVSFQAPAGAHAFSAPMAVGPQSFALTRGDKNIFSGTSLRNISAICPCGIYNFNAFVGSMPPGPSDPMGPDGLGLLTFGLHVTTCQPTPSLATVMPSYTTGGRVDPTHA